MKTIFIYWNQCFCTLAAGLWLLTSSVAAQDITTGLVAHWKFDDAAGVVAADSTAFGNNADLFGGTTWTSDSVGNGAIEFDGSGDYATTGQNFSPPSAGAVAFWMRGAGPLPARQRLFGVNGNWEVRQETNGTLSFDLGASPFVGNEPFSTTTAVDGENRWYHIVAIFDASDDSYAVYVDGELRTSGTSPVNLVPQPAGLLSFGTRTGSSEYWEGALRDFRIYNRQLTAIEVTELYGLVGHWKFDEGVGGAAADSTAFGNDATLNGATWTTSCSGETALGFDGAGDTAATDSSFDPPATGAVAYWMRAAGPLSARQRIFGVNGNWEARVEPNGTISFDLGASPFVGNEPFATTTTLDDENRWYHIVANFDATDDSYEVYVNGELEASGTSPVNLVEQADGILTFGTRTGSTEYWEGALRDFRVYNRPLLSYEIAELSGIIAHWNLDESSGTVAADAGVLGNNAAYVNSPTLGVNGPYVPSTGTAVELNGTSESITAGQSLMNDLTKFSLMGWVRPDSTTPDKSFFGQTNLIELGIDFQTNQIDLWTVNGGSINAATQLPIGKWTHVAATGDGTKLTLYVNGIEVSSGGSTTVDYGNNSEVFKIGEGVLNTSGDYFDGRIDDVRVYSRAMCPEEINATYKGGRPAGIRIIQWLEVR